MFFRIFVLACLILCAFIPEPLRAQEPQVISLVSSTDDYAFEFNAAGQVTILSVPNWSAYHGHFRSGDVIVKVDGQAYQQGMLTPYRQQVMAGQRNNVSVTVNRGGTFVQYYLMRSPTAAVQPLSAVTPQSQAGKSQHQQDMEDFQATMAATQSAMDLASDPALQSCFIATAAYGSSQADDVELLRQFRNEYLLTNPIGRGFVRAYYYLSPPVAEVIHERPWARQLTLLALSPLVLIASALMGDAASLLIMSMILVMIILFVRHRHKLIVLKKRERGLQPIVN